MGSFISRHQTTLLVFATVLSAAGMIWLDEHRHSGSIPALPAGAPAPGFSIRLLGSQAPAGFDLKPTDGQQRVTLATLHGKPAVLDFWATWCAPCRATLPHIDALARQYEGRARFIAVDAEGEDEARVTAAKDKLGLTMPVAIEGMEAAGVYNIEYLPTTVVLDSTGHVAQTFTGPTDAANIAKALDKLL